MPSDAFRPCPEVYLLTASRAAFASAERRDGLDDFDRLVADIKTEGFTPRCIHAPQDPTNIAALVEALPLNLLAQRRQRIVAFIYWFDHWEKALSAHAGAKPIAEITDSNSVIRNVLIQRFRGIPFLGVNVNPGQLAGKWGVHLKRDERRQELEKWRKNPQTANVSGYFASKFGVAIRELNQGMLLSPFPEQLRRPYFDAVRQAQYDRLLEGARRLGIQLDTLTRALAQAFPEGEPVEIVKCMGGLSGALVFVARTRDSAPKLIKLCDWHTAQSEYEGARFVIGPRLTNFAAVAITPGNDTGPSRFQERSGQTARTLGLIVYSIVGTPGGDLTIRGFSDLVSDLQADPARVEHLLPRIDSTLCQVLGQLHGEHPRRTRRTLWGWLGAYLPPLYQLDLDETTHDKLRTLTAYSTQGFKPDSAVLLAEAEWRTLTEGELIELEDALITEIDEESITVAHPDLGFRLICRGSIDACLKDAAYLKIGHPVRVRGRITLAESDWAASLTDDPFGSWLIPRSWEAAGELPFALWFEGRAGAIHGDLNLNNIQFSEATPLGWLIDFDRSDADGMIAFDFAKLELELHSHHLIPTIHRLSRILPHLTRFTTVEVMGQRLLSSVLRSLDHFSGQARDILPLWRTLMQELRLPVDHFAPGSLSPLEAILSVLAVVRARANRLLRPDAALGEPPTDLALALSAYALSAVKFAERQGRLERLPYLKQIARHYGTYWAPPRLEEQIDPPGASVLDQQCRSKMPDDLRAIDGYLYRVTRVPQPLASMVQNLRGTSEPLIWENPQAWDVSSTGCVANMSPLIGYLWLMARRATDSTVVVPKIASRGASCGTIDILEAGGYRFPDTPNRIRQAINAAGGVLCRQSEEMVRVDRFTMERRKARNLMKHPALMLASVLAKKTLMGCTHAVIDVKLGRDSKLIRSDQATLNSRLCASEERHSRLLPDSDIRALLGQALQPWLGAPETDTDAPWLRYPAPDGTGIADSSVRELRLLCTSADVPQGRAIGRLLILCQLNQALGDSQPFIDWPEDYRRFYLEVLKQACDAPETLAVEALRDAWNSLKDELPIFTSNSGHEHAALLTAMGEIFTESPEVDRRRHARPLITDRHREDDVHVLTLPHDQAGQVLFIDAYALDALFEELCGDDAYDPAVGFWLHRLPGETAEPDKPFISVFFRPSVMTENALRHRLDAFLTENVRIQQGS